MTFCDMREKLLIFIFALLILNNISWSQNFKNERRIFLWDVTLSMYGFGGAPIIGDEVQKNLIQAIENITDPQTEIIVIPFQDNVLHVWKNKATVEGKRELLKKVASIKERDLEVTRTNICSAWEEALTMISPHQRNYIFLLTDGKQNSKQNSENCLNENVSAWCSIAKSNDSFGFYVMLTDAARNPELEEEIDACSRLEIVTGTNINVVELRPTITEINLNVPDKEFEKEILFETNYFDGIPEDFQMRLSLNENSFIQLKNNNIKMGKNGKCRIEFTPLIPYEELRIQLPANYEIDLVIQIDNNKFPRIFATPSNLKVVLKNIREKIMTIEIVK